MSVTSCSPGCLPILLDSPLGSLRKKIVSLLFHLLASTFHTEPVGLHAMLHFSDTSHANASQINRYLSQALDWFVQLPGIYLYLHIPQAL